MDLRSYPFHFQLDNLTHCSVECPLGSISGCVKAGKIIALLLWGTKYCVLEWVLTSRTLARSCGHVIGHAEWQSLPGPPLQWRRRSLDHQMRIHKGWSSAMKMTRQSECYLMTKQSKGRQRTFTHTWNCWGNTFRICSCRLKPFY